MKMRPWLIGWMLISATPAAVASSEVEILRSRCMEQERQIRHLEDENSKLRSLNVEARTTPVAAAKAPTEAAASGGTYVVKAGDNLDKIARTLGTNSQKLAKENGLKSSSIIQPGQKLKVPAAATRAARSVPTAAAPAAPKPTEAPPARQATAPRTYKVTANDTYSSISRKHKVSIAELIAANPNTKPTALRVGQTINLGRQAAPRTQTVTASAPAPAVTKTSSAVPTHSLPPAAPALAPQAPAPAKAPLPETAEVPEKTPVVEKKVRPILIEQEMSYGAFAAQHGTDAARLNALNGLELTTATILAKGSELYVPGQQ